MGLLERLHSVHHLSEPATLLSKLEQGERVGPMLPSQEQALDSCSFCHVETLQACLSKVEEDLVSRVAEGLVAQVGEEEASLVGEGAVSLVGEEAVSLVEEEVALLVAGKCPPQWNWSLVQLLEALHQA